MSFSTDVKNELNDLVIKKNCCKKAYVLGVLISAQCAQNSVITVNLTDDSTAQKLNGLLGTLYKITPSEVITTRGCYRSIQISFESKSIAEFICECDLADNNKAQEIIDRTLKCNGCASSFLAGVFCSCGTVSDPRKSYTLELRCSNENRAAVICSAIERFGLTLPCLTQRKGAFGLFYRNEDSIEDMLTACGASNALFIFFDVAVEKNLRNKENRATNCVAKNISKTVNAAALQVEAIETLIAAGIYEDLPDEIKRTGNLRLANPDVSLSELVELHVPRISKSGLNHRLSKLIELAKKNELI